VLALVIDTSTAAVTAALAQVEAGVSIVASSVTVDARAHGELLAPAIASCLAQVDLAPAGVDAVVVGLGPGPFTGLRVGLVTAAVFAEACGIPAYGVCSLDAIAMGLDARSLLVATDARRREVYWARYAHGVRVEGPCVDRPTSLTVRESVMAGAGARLYEDVLGLPLLDMDYPSPLALALCAADRIRSHAPTEALTPLYLRRPDAVAPGPAKQVTQ
jgi:tRNA threonylcarbamoyl adenosine modification protein YeaZ